LQSLDNALLAALNRGVTNDLFDWLMPRITNLHQQTWFLALLALFCMGVLWKGGRRRRVWVVCALVAVGLSDLLSSRAIKAVLPRDRPCHQRAETGRMAFPATRLVPGEHCPGSPSFPSSHAVNTMAVAVVGWWFTRRRARWAWFLLPLILGYSRVYLGYHYPSDVVGGWIVGGLVAGAVIGLLGDWAIETLDSPSPNA